MVNSKIILEYFGDENAGLEHTDIVHHSEGKLVKIWLHDFDISLY